MICPWQPLLPSSFSTLTARKSPQLKTYWQEEKKPQHRPDHFALELTAGLSVCLWPRPWYCNTADMSSWDKRGKKNPQREPRAFISSGLLPGQSLHARQTVTKPQSMSWLNDLVNLQRITAPLPNTGVCFFSLLQHVIYTLLTLCLPHFPLACMFSAVSVWRLKINNKALKLKIRIVYVVSLVCVCFCQFKWNPMPLVQLFRSP